jgi:hypothetical protein
MNKLTVLAELMLVLMGLFLPFYMGAFLFG